MGRRLTWSSTWEFMTCCPGHRPKRIHRPKAPYLRENLHTFEEQPYNITICVYRESSLKPCQEDPSAIYQKDHVWRERKYLDHAGLLDSDSELTIIHGEPNCQHGLPGHGAGLWRREAAQVHVVEGQVGLQAHPVLTCPGSEYMMETVIISHCRTLIFVLWSMK